jgi:hypothetical protein
VHPDDRERAAGILADWPHEEQSPDPLAPFKVRHKDGTWRVMEAVGRSVDSTDPLQGMILNARDVTERVRAQEKLLETEAKLRQAHKMEAVGRLAGGIAHDFNNVLTAIYGYADLLLEEFVAGDPRRSDVEEIRRMAERAATLTRQLLAFSRQQMLQPQILDLNIVIEEVQRMLARMIGTDIQLFFEPSRELWPVKADRGQIEQVLMNLGGNARDAMPEGGSLTIRTSNRELAASRLARWMAWLRRLRGDVGDRYGSGHARARAPPRLRAVLHDQGAGRRHRARAGDDLRHREAERRRDFRRERREQGNDLYHLPSPHRSRPRYFFSLKPAGQLQILRGDRRGHLERFVRQRDHRGAWLGLALDHLACEHSTQASTRALLAILRRLVLALDRLDHRYCRERSALELGPLGLQALHGLLHHRIHGHGCRHLLGRHARASGAMAFQ